MRINIGVRMNTGNTAKALNKKKYHYTYIVTNQETGMKYFGVRSCDCTPDTDIYMGSSKYLTADIDELGIDKFKKEIHGHWETREVANEVEDVYLKEVDAKRNPEYYNRANSHKDMYFDYDSLSDEEKETATAKLLETAGTEEAKAKMRVGLKKTWAEHKDKMIAKIHHKDRDYTGHLAPLAKGRGKSSSRLKGVDRTEAQKLADKTKDSSHLHSAEVIAKSAATRTGRKRPEHAEAMTGRKAMIKDSEQISVPMDEIGKYIAEGWVLGSKQKGQPKGKQKELTCPHCGKVGGAANMKRYHMDNCKLKQSEGK